jgi:hypothetical protein
MSTLRTDKHSDFHWTPLNIGFSVIMGVAATVGIWLFTGILMGLFIL